MKRLAPVLLSLTLPLTASAADLDLGVGIAATKDMPDAVSKDYASFGFGPALLVPVRIGLADHAAIRLTGRADVGTGTDQVTWTQEGTTYGNQDHFAMLVGAGLTAGPEFSIPAGPIDAYVGAGAGVALVNTYHSFGGPTQPLLADYSKEDLEDPNNVDPHTSQVSWLSDVFIGAKTTGDVGGWFEVGYHNSFVAAQTLKNTPPALAAQRSAYAWNALRIGAGVRFSL